MGMRSSSWRCASNTAFSSPGWVEEAIQTGRPSKASRASAMVPSSCGRGPAMDLRLIPGVTRSAGALIVAMARAIASFCVRIRSNTPKRNPALAGFLFGVFDLILTQNDAMARAMATINAPADRVTPGINLKSMAGPLPQDEGTIAEAREALEGRPVWIASSTHPGEEKAVLEAHRQLLERIPM